MLSWPCCLKTNLRLLPSSFFLKSYLLLDAVLLRCLRLLSSSSAAASLVLEQTRSPLPLHDSSSTFVLSEETCLHFLSQCKSMSLNQATCVHSPVIKLGLESHLRLCNNLHSLYSKHGHRDGARKLFDRMPFKDIVSWTAEISALVQSGSNEEALYLYHRMLLSGLVPNHFTFSSIMRCVASLRDFDLGTSLHTLIIKRGFGSNSILASSLLDFYSKCDLFDEACQVFELMDDRDAVSWTAMISASVQAEDWRISVCLYIAMLRDGISPNEFTFTKLLTACSNLGSRLGERVHAHLILLGIKLNLALKTALVDMYSKCNKMTDALKILHYFPTSESDVMLWTTIISGHARAGDCSKAVSVFRDMQIEAPFPPNSFTYTTLINVSSSAPLPEVGRLFHCLVVKVGLEHDVFIGNAIVDLYSKWSPMLEDALSAFQDISSPNVVSWTALIAGLVLHGKDFAAMEAYVEMQAAGVKPSSFTLSTILTGLSSAEAVSHAQKLHAIVLKSNSDTWDITVGNSLVDVYAKLGRPSDAKKVFDDVPQRDFYTYTSLAKGLNQARLHREALSLITLLRAELAGIDCFSLASFLSAATGLAAVQCGRQLHCYSIRSGLDGGISVLNSLVDMYGKCGRIDEARAVFAAIQLPNAVSWNGLISGLASNGCFADALLTFEDMRMEGALPDSVTFLIVLYACGHGGLIDLGIDYFNSMEEQFGLQPEEDHYVCLVDMLGRAGRLEAATAAIEVMPYQPRGLIYKTLLACCRLHGNVALGEWSASRAIDMDPSDSGVYMLLAGLYDDAGRMELGDEIRRMMRARGVNKSPARSWM